MSLPNPQPGLVIAYAYLRARARTQGAEDGRKKRPCAVIAARQIIGGHEIVTILSITHTPPTNPADAVEIPLTPKSHLGLDAARSWIIVSEHTTSCGPAQTSGQGSA